MKATMPMKTYLLLLLTFVLLLNGGLFAVTAVSYSQALSREYSLLEGEAALLSRYMEMTDIGASRDMEELLSEVFKAHDLFLSIDGRYSDGNNETGEWEPPASLLTATAEEPVTARVTLKGRPCAAYSFLLRDQGQNVEVHVVLLRNIASLEKDYLLLTLTVFLGSLTASVVFALLLRGAGVRNLPLTEEAVGTDGPAHKVASAALTSSKTDLGLLCRRLLEELEVEAEEKGITLTGSAMPLCTVAGKEAPLSDFLTALLRWGLTSAQDSISLLVTRENETVTLHLTKGDSEGSDAFADAARLVGGSLTAFEGGVTVTWEAFHE